MLDDESPPGRGPEMHRNDSIASREWYNADGSSNYNLSIEIPKLKLLVIGHGRHGKDTVSEILCKEMDLHYQSSSEFCAGHVMFPVLSKKYGYKTVEECYADRHNHRQEWYEMISGYCGSDLARLGREIFQKFDIYCGLRNKREWASMKNEGVYDYCIWVDRSDHLESEDETSNTMQPWMAEFVIDNNGTVENLEFNIKSLIDNRLI